MCIPPHWEDRRSEISQLEPIDADEKVVGSRGREVGRALPPGRAGAHRVGSRDDVRGHPPMEPSAPAWPPSPSRAWPRWCSAVLLLAATPQADRLGDGGILLAVLLVAMGLGFTALGAFATLRRPDNRTGVLMIAEGLIALVTGLQISDTSALFVAGSLTDALVITLFAHLLLAFPTGRIETRGARIVATAGAVAAALQILAGAVQHPAGPRVRRPQDCPHNILLIARAPRAHGRRRDRPGAACSSASSSRRSSWSSAATSRRARSRGAAWPRCSCSAR